MFKLLITIIAIAIAKMTEATPMGIFPFYDPLAETDNIDEQDYMGNEVYKAVEESPPSSFDSISPMLTQKVDKRHRNINDPCGCPYKIEIGHYDRNAFPQVIREKVCDKERIRRMPHNCRHGTTCKEVYYEMKYIYPLDSNSELKTIDVPRSLGEHGWIAKNISIDCRCMH